MKVHLIGIAGTGMGSIAGLLKAAGHEVRGSDEKVYPPMSDQLRELGVPVAEGFAAANLDWHPDRVVVGNVCRRDHVEVVAAQERGLTLTSFPAILEELLLPGRHSVVVSGTHGKTTTTSLLAHCLWDAGKDPSALIGGVPLGWGRGYRLGHGEHFVIEGDEYDTAFFDKGSKFLHYQPRTVILSGVELDHVDIFDSLAAVKAAFARFIALIPEDGRLIVAASSATALELSRAARCTVETYAAAGRAVPGVTPDWHASILPGGGARTRFVVTRRGEGFGAFHLGLPGEHNLENALSVIAAGSSLGVGPAELGRAVARFRGVKRRQEVRGVAAGVTVIDDYAHHPTAVRETLAALRSRRDRGKLVALYEPRSATSRRATFQADFADAFASADEVVVTRLFDPDRIPPAERFDPERLATDLHARGVSARYLAEVGEVVEHVATRVKPGDCVAVFSSGAFGGVHDKLLARLGDPVMPAKPEDMRKVRTILDRAQLPHKDLADDRFGDVLVIKDEDGEAAATVTVEPHDDAAILRSLAVMPERRGRGYGWMLADAAVQRARELGAQRLYLLTETASDFFAEKLGFRPVDRVSVEPSVAASSQFRDPASRSAVCMKLEL